MYSSKRRIQERRPRANVRLHPTLLNALRELARTEDSTVDLLVIDLINEALGRPKPRGRCDG
jgi:hypothetical protein